jgi:hypothetical protein
MIPTPMLPTESGAERKLFEGLRGQLPDDLVVYHGVKWLQLDERAREGESDFLIADPRRGILCVEVKGGALSFDPATRTRQQNGRPLKKDPFAQAQETVHWLEQRMKTVPGWSKWKPAFGYAVAFPDGDYEIEAHPNSPLDITIDRRDMDTLAGRVAKIMDRWGNAHPAAAADGMRALQETMGYRIEVIAPLGVRFDDAERMMIELTEEQSYIRDFVRRQPRLAVMGTAGSGKTLIAIQTAVWLAQNGQRTLFTCLNKRLGRHIAEMTSADENIRASHFHALAYELALEADVIEEQGDQALPGETTYFSDDLPAALKRAAKVLATRFDAIVVDEAQDFQEQYWEGLLAFHSSPERTPLYLFADDNQNIYEGSALPVQPNEIFGPLRKNMRNSQEIQQFLLALHSREDAPIVGGPEVGPVRVMAYSDSEDLAKKCGDVLAELLGEGVALDDIVLLTPSTVAKSALRSRPDIGGIPISEDELPGTLLTSTLHGFKGLEKPVVILAELGERGEKRLVEYLYVGGSRARFQLILLAIPEVANMLEQLPGTQRVR